MVRLLGGGFLIVALIALIADVRQLPGWLVCAALGLGVLLLGFIHFRRRQRAFASSEPSAEMLKGAKAGARAPAGAELAIALQSCRSAFAGIGLLSGMSSVLMLTGSFFMLEVYDRVLPSRSVPTLVGLAILAVMLFAAQGIIDVIRGRLLVRIGGVLDQSLSGRVYDAMVRLPVRLGSRQDGAQPVRDLDNVRSFLSSGAPIALFDLPWLPLYLFVLFAFHPLLGATALCGAVVLTGLTVLTEVLTRGPTMTSTRFSIARNRLAEASRQNAEVVVAMGLTRRMGDQWNEANRSYQAAQQRVSDVGGGLGAIARVLRLILQSGVLAVGALLVIRQEATPGIIIAGSILTARALAPVDLAIANWRGFVVARQSWQRLKNLLTLLPGQYQPMPLPAPATSISVEAVSAVPPGEQKLVMQDVSFTLTRGQGLGIIGPSASGKSSLVRILVGAWLPARGRVRLDGASLDQWAPEALGRHIGYLPQDVELFMGTVAQNIARFDGQADPEAIVRAARAADVHDLVVGLPNGYETQIGEYGAALSAGQRQRLALARALYGDPFLVVLDELDSNLDAEGEQALRQAILGVRQRGGIVVVIAHRPSVLVGVDLLLAVHRGRPVAMGPKDAVLQKLRPIGVPPEPGLRVIPETGRAKA
jgi:ATP-binding cassette subfamily C protein